MIPYPVENTLRKLISQHPKTFFDRPNRVQPITKSAYDALAGPSTDALVVSALSLYTESRHYKQAVAEGRAALDLAGNEVEFPSKEEMSAAGEWLCAYSIEKC